MTRAAAIRRFTGPFFRRRLASSLITFLSCGGEEIGAISIVGASSKHVSGSPDGSIRRLFLNEESSAEHTPTKEKKILRAKVVSYKLDPELYEVPLSYQVSATLGKFRNLSYQTSFDRMGAVFAILDPTVRATSAVRPIDQVPHFA